MILDMRRDYKRSDAEQATVIVNAELDDFINYNLNCNNAQIISFGSFKDEKVCTANKINKFLEKRELFCPKLELIDLSRACSPDADLESNEAKRFYRFVKALKENTDIDIVATPELEKLFPVLLQEKEEEDNLLDAYVIPLKEEKLSSLQAVTLLQLAQAEKKLSPELCRDILEHNNNNVVTQRVISAIDTQLSQGNEQLDQYIPTLLGCVAGRYVSPDNFDAIIDIAEKYIPQNNITTEDINLCFGLQKQSSQSEESYQRINNLIKGLTPHFPKEVRQELEAKAALKEKKQQEYLQKRQQLQTKVNEYSGYLILSDALKEDASSAQIRKVGDTIYEYAEKYPDYYATILDRINTKQDEYEIKAAANWIEPTILRINAFGENETDVKLLTNLTDVVTQDQDVRHKYGHIFCQQLKKNTNSEFWLKRITRLLNRNKDDHILLMNTYEDMEQAYKIHPELIPQSLAIFKKTLSFTEISKGFNDHLHTLASIVGDTAHDHPEFTDTAIEILSDLSNIEQNSFNSPARKYLRSKIDDAFDKIKQNDISLTSRRNLTVIYEKDQAVFADVIKELMNNPQTDQQLIEQTIRIRLNSGLNVLIDDYNSPECLKWNLAVLQSKALQRKGPESISACAEQIFKNGVLKQWDKNPNYDVGTTLQAIYDAAPFWLKKLREKNSDTEDFFILQHFDRIPKEIQKLYISEYPVKIDNLIATDNLKNFPEIIAQKLKFEVCDYISDISAKKTYTNNRSLDGMEKWATFLKENNGYSSPEACVIALNEAMRIRESISRVNLFPSCEYARKHFIETKTDTKQFVKISTDIIDNVFEQIRRHKNNPSLINALKEAKFYGLDDKRSLQDIMGREATKAFLSGDENYKKLWDKEMVSNSLSAFLMFEKPDEIMQGSQLIDKLRSFDMIASSTYIGGDETWKEFPELLTASNLYLRLRHCPDITDKDVVKAVKTYCKLRINDVSLASYQELSMLMVVYDAEAEKGIEDKEIFSILYKARFSEKSDKIRDDMNEICSDLHLTAPKLKSLCQTSHLINRLLLKRNTKEDK